MTPESVVVSTVVNVTDTITTYSPVALYLMVDRSGSMITGFPVGSAESWSSSTSGLVAFTNDPQSAGLDVGLGFFPPLSGAGMCDGSDCGTPAVEIGPLPRNGAAIVSAMTSGTPTPTNLTPTECALRGMIDHCTAYESQSGEPCFAVLVTDGAPTTCDTSTANLLKIVADGMAAGVSTFTLGLAGSDLTFLDSIAQAGGTTAAVDVSAGSSAFIAGLDAIRARVAVTSTHQVVTPETVQTVLPCEWEIPPPLRGQRFDATTVNVEVALGGSGPFTLRHVASRAACAGAGWYYNDAINPARVLACPTTCDSLEASPGARVQLMLGCGTVSAP